MSTALDTLVDNLRLEQLEHNLFRGVSLDQTRFRVYGGQVLGQAVAAACQTVDTPYQAHSLASYFVRPGDTSIPIIYDVERIRDGNSFLTRRVTAIQKGKSLFSMGISFQKPEQGFEHQAPMPQVPGPEGLVSEEQRRLQKMKARNIELNYRFAWPIEFRHVEPIDFHQRRKQAPASYVWFKANGPLPNDFALHQSILAYASDVPILVTSCRPHDEINAGNALFATINHSMWFHRPFRMDEWLLYTLDSPNASGGRGFARGNIYSQDGTLVASATQEGIIRIREDSQEVDLIGDPTGYKQCLSK